MLKLNSVNVTPTPKIYYNKYAFKVTVAGNQWFHDAVRFEEVFKWLSDRNNLPDLWNEYTSVQRKNLNIYFRDVTTAQNFINEFSDLVIELHAPYNKAVHKELKKGEFDCREKLYFGKYRYRVELFKHWRSKTTEATKIDNVMTSLYKRGSNRIHRSNSGYSHILYTNEKHDIARIKLVLDKESVRDLKVCKLYSETTLEK